MCWNSPGADTASWTRCAVCARRSASALGVVDIKDNGIEDPNRIAERIELAENRLGAGRVQYIHPDCGFWMLPRSVADGKMRALTEGRDLFLGVS